MTSERDFKQKLSRASEEMSQRTGMTHSFVPLSVEEAKEAGQVTEEGLEETHRKHRELGWTEPSREVHDLGAS